MPLHGRQSPRPRTDLDLCRLHAPGLGSKSKTHSKQQLELFKEGPYEVVTLGNTSSTSVPRDKLLHRTRARTEEGRVPFFPPHRFAMWVLWKGMSSGNLSHSG